MMTGPIGADALGRPLFREGSIANDLFLHAMDFGNTWEAEALTPADESTSVRDGMSIIAEVEEAVPALRRYAWSLLRQREGADDLVQDTLERALVYLPRLVAGTAVRPWLFTIMHNLSVSRWRQLRRRARWTVQQEDQDAAVPAEQEAGLARRDLLAGLELLPEEQRQVLLLVTVEGFEYREVAGILGVPIGTVMSRLSRARDRLRMHMEGREREPLRRVK